MHAKKVPHKNLERFKGTFFQIGLILSLAFIFFAFQWKTFNRYEKILPHGTVISPDVDLIPVTIPKPPPPPPTDLAQIDIVKNDDPVDVPDLVINTGSDILVEVPVLQQLPPKPEEPADPYQIFIAVEKMPEFPGGGRALIEYLSKNVKYPRLAQEAGIRGTVYVGFVVEPDGSISNLKVLRGIGGGCDEEAIRVFSTMPRWQPGMQSGRAVRVSFSASITFRLQ
ncbi:MAG: TonB family protein [Bacteroidales bacterium]|nr:TonB family protein [Bacteroidales bacterium]